MRVKQRSADVSSICSTHPHLPPTRLTRLWSMISAMTAILPAEGPSLTRTTRPTSTNRLKVDGC